MANTKKESFSKVKNQKPEMEIIEETSEGKIIEKDELLPETRSMVPVKEFAKPLITAEEATQTFQQYQKLINALIKQSDIVEIQGKQKIKKTGINKIARFFGVSTEIIRHHKENKIGPQGGKTFTWYVWVKAWLPSGQSRVDGAACASNERRFAHLENDVLTTAITRATKRVVENLVGMGEYESIDEGNGEPSEEEKPSDTPPVNNPIPEYPTKEIKPGVTAVVKEEKSILKPMYKSPVCNIVNYEIEASSEQKQMIFDLLTKEGVDLAADKPVIFTLGRKPNTRKVRLEKMTKLDAWDLICAVKKGDISKVLVIE